MLGILRFPFDEDGDGRPMLSVVATVMTPTRRFILVPPNGRERVDENCDGEFIVAEQEQFVSELWPVPLAELGFQLPYSIVLITVDGLAPTTLAFTDTTG